MKIPTICDYCGGRVILTDSAIVYHGKSYGNIYYCTNCGAYVGASTPAATNPLGHWPTLPFAANARKPTTPLTPCGKTRG